MLDAAGVTAGTRLLEIGTGWGSLAIRAAERGAHGHHPHHLGAAGRAGARADRRRPAVAERVEVALRDYRDQHGTYDAVVSVEMIEAVGEKYWPTYFAKIDEVLAPGGKAAIQAILLEHHRMVATRNTYAWIHKYIFPGGLLPSTEAIEDVLSQHTSLHVPRRRRHRARTTPTRCGCGASSSWPTGSRSQALGFDDTFRRMWEFYLAYCEAGFRTGYLDDAIITIER